MKTDLEKQDHEHQKSFAEVTVKHSKELKDLGKKRTGSVSAQSRDSISLSLQGSIIPFFCLPINPTQRYPTARS